MGDVPPANGANQKCNSAKHSIRIETIPLNKIKGEHPAVESIRRKTTGHLRQLPDGAFSGKGLAEIAQLTMLHVVPKGEEYYCIGPLRLFRMLKSTLSSADELPVIVHHRMGWKELEGFLLLDLLIVPVFYCLDPKDRVRMNTAWENPNAAGLIHHVVKPIVNPRGKALSALAHILNCDARTLKERHAAEGDAKADEKDRRGPKDTTSEVHTGPETAATRKVGAA
jgi:hypothetical protein